MTQRLGIIGAGGHGRETYGLAQAINRLTNVHWEILGFLVEGNAEATAELIRLGVAIIGAPSDLEHLRAQFVIAIGDSSVRKRIAEQIPSSIPVATLRHPDSSIGHSVFIDEGVLVQMGSSVGQESRIGRHSHLNVSATVGDRCEIGSYVSLSPGSIVQSSAVIGDEVFVGTRAIVCEGVTVGTGAVIGAGAVVTRDVKKGATVVGNPAVNIGEN
jgi:sugar O-acyltransferase (sialic acid O-acetyltransferase NeuD family)